MQARDLLMALPTLVDISIEQDAHITVVGDVHGQFYDLLNIFEMNGLPSEDNPYVFNGANTTIISAALFKGPYLFSCSWLECACSMYSRCLAKQKGIQAMVVSEPSVGV
jgi:hypothetical protein